MFTAATQLDAALKIAELRFCLAELQRRQQTDRRRAWLWLLKENAGQQMLAMLQQAAPDAEVVELTTSARAELLRWHSLLLDPYDERPSIPPQWRLQLQAHVRETLGSYLAERQRQEADG